MELGQMLTDFQNSFTAVEKEQNFL